MNDTHHLLSFTEYHQDRVEEVDGQIAIESLVSISINGEHLLTIMCSPVELDVLTLGFLFNEGIIDSMDDVLHADITPNERNVDVWLKRTVEIPANWYRTSGCAGGSTSTRRIETESIHPLTEVVISYTTVLRLMKEFLEMQQLNRQAGGIHSSAFSDGEKILLLYDDIGRHNTLDKIAGRLLLEPMELDNRIILSTGRISSEMLQKAFRLGASIVISRSSPTSLSVDLAKEVGVTLIGYARGARFSIYSHPERITHPSFPSDEGLATNTP